MSRWRNTVAVGLAMSVSSMSAFAQGPLGGVLNGAQNQAKGVQQGVGGAAQGAQQAPRAVQPPPRAITPPPVQAIPKVTAPPVAPKVVTPPINRGNVEPKSAVPNVPKPVVPPNPIRPNPAIPQVNPNIPKVDAPKVDATVPKVNPTVPQVNPNLPRDTTRTLPRANGPVDSVQKQLPTEVRANKFPNSVNIDPANRNLPRGPLNGPRHTLGGTQINVGPRSINIGNSAYRPAYNRHPRYYAGYWNGNYGPGWGYGGGWGNGYYGNNAYGYRPLGWGLGAWGLGALAYNSGYLGYSNPYYTNGGYNGYNYAQPIPIVYDTTSSGTATDNSTDSVLQSAVAAFQQNDYDQALDIVNKGIAQSPNDAVLHEFRALVLFAKADYQQAAATIHSVLAVGPGWNWETIRNIYPNVATYTTQLRSLESVTKQNPQDSASRFLLAYHYMVGGHQEDAARKLDDVVKLTPNDRVAVDLLQMLRAPAPNQTAANPAPAGNDVATNPEPRPGVTETKIDAAMLVGTWSASRDDGSQFTMTLNQDGTFNWKFKQKNADQAFDGKYTVEGNVLALERKAGGSLVATVTPDGEQKFNFKLLGAPPSDPGLNFTSANQQ